MMRFDEDLNENERQTLKDMSKIIHIRKNHPALRYGDFLTLQADKNIYAYIRSDMNERILVVINKSEMEQIVDLTLPPIYSVRGANELITGESLQVKDNVIKINISGIRCLILKLN
jgi:glycosidase